MRKPNLKILTEKELNYFDEHYIIKSLLEYNLIVVECKTYNRQTVHDLRTPFVISSKIRKITISIDAINLWIKYFEKLNISIIKIQNIINKLIKQHVDVNVENIKKELLK